jgi:hypothetical protein
VPLTVAFSGTQVYVMIENASLAAEAQAFTILEFAPFSVFLTTLGMNF